MKRMDDRRLLFGWGFLISVFLLLTSVIFAGTALAQESEGREVVAETPAECGLLAYEWKGEVTEADRGFPKEQPPRNNFNWIKPENYAGGTLHLRVEIIDQPVVQDNMHLQLCFWQPTASKPGNRFALETCSKQTNVAGYSGNVITWSQDIEAMWKLNKKPLDWNRPRYRSAVAIKNRQKPSTPTVPVSNYSGWNWNRENPKEWFPLEMHFIGRVTPPGVEFIGWQACAEPTAITMQSINAREQGDKFFTPLLLIALFASMVVITAVLFLWNRQPVVD